MSGPLHDERLDVDAHGFPMHPKNVKWQRSPPVPAAADGSKPYSLDELVLIAISRDSSATEKRLAMSLAFEMGVTAGMSTAATAAGGAR
jgi:hypothetical protein